jgi:hypothetical protein
MDAGIGRGQVDKANGKIGKYPGEKKGVFT